MESIIFFDKKSGLHLRTIGKSLFGDNEHLITSLAFGLNHLLKEFNLHESVPEGLVDYVSDEDGMKVINYSDYKVYVPLKGSPFGVTNNDYLMRVIEGFYVNALVFSKLDDYSLTHAEALLHYYDRKTKSTRAGFIDDLLPDSDLFAPKSLSDVAENIYAAHFLGR